VDADDLELGEVDGDGVDRPRPADALEAGLERHADLDLNGHIELDALGVEGIEGAVVRRDSEPVRVAVGAQGSMLTHRRLEPPNARDDVSRVDAGRPAETIRILVDHRLGVFVRDAP
jgi:hypothetical protein